MKMKPYLCILILCLLFPALSQGAESPVGSIKTLEGDVLVLRGGQSIPASIGMPVFQGDIIQTPASGSAGIIFRDDSIISLGPESKLSIMEYVFEPKDEKFSMLMKMIKGTFVYISGAIGKLSPDSIKLETPSSIIAVRGTKMLIEVKG
ncbi:MAG: FecR domain-containing protein [Desulfobacterales bacterium]|nr:FecR domain-containing protein [Desulfobacterales bacterium]